MKKLSLAFALLMSIGLTSFDAPAKTAVDFPYYDFNNSHALDIRRVETDVDSVTIYADLYSRPDAWVRIASTSYIKGNRSGKVFPIAACEGLVLDKETYPGESGRIPFVMKFGALAPEDDGFDFAEADGPGVFRVNGISLDMPLSYGNVTCHLEGEVTDPHVSRLIVIESSEDPRIVDKFVSIPVENGRFSYDFNADKDGYYEVFPYNEYLKGAWRHAKFFAYDGFVHFNIPDNDEPIEVTSTQPDQLILASMGALKQSYYNLINEKGKTVGKDNVFNEEGKELIEQMKTAQGDERQALMMQLQGGDFYSQEYKAYREFSDSILNEVSKMEIRFLAENPSLYSLVTIYSTLCDRDEDEERKMKYIELYDSVLADYHPDYYYHDKINALRRAQQLKPGKKYIDYNVTLENGDKVPFSQLADGKVTLVDLWASWCGPCRRLSISYIPVYEKYKDDGFNVVSIAREQNAESMQLAAEQDAYPWKSYLELNDENKIWMLNGVGNAGGTTFLINKDGTIIFVHPTAEELDQILSILKQQGKL